MKLIIRIIAIGALTYFVSPVGSWWMVMAISFVVCFISPSSGLNAFIAGFLGVGLTWMGHAWNLDVINASAFSSKIVEVMGLGESIYLVLATGAVGGIAGGAAAITGTTFRQMFLKPKQRSLSS